MRRTDEELIDEATVIRDETETHANTPLRVGEMLINIIESKPNYSTSGKKPVIGCGEWSASSNAFPSGAIGTGTDGAIEYGNEFVLVGDGTIGGDEILEVNKMIARALYDTPGQDAEKWKIY